MGMRPPWKSQPTCCKSHLGFTPLVSSQYNDKRNVNLKFPSFYPFTKSLWYCWEVTGTEEEPGSAAAWCNRNAPPGPTVNALSHPPPWKTPLMGCKHKDKGEGAGRTAMAEARASGLTAAHSPRSRLHGWGHPSVFSWATFH